MTLNRTPLMMKLPIMTIHARRPPSGGTITLRSSASFLEAFIDARSSSSLSVLFDFAIDTSILTDEFLPSVSKRGLPSVLEFEASSGRCESSFRELRSRTSLLILEMFVESVLFDSVFSAIVIVQLLVRFCRWISMISRKIKKKKG